MEQKEQMIIEAVLHDNSIIENLEFLEPKHFVDNRHVYEAILRGYNDAQSVTVVDLMLDDVNYELSGLDAVTKTQAIISARALFDNFQLNIIKNSIKKMDFENLDDTLEKMNLIVETVEANYERNKSIKPVNIHSFIEDMREIRRDEKKAGIFVSTLPSFNAITGGMLGGDLIGIYGKEKSTKTTLTHEVVLDVALKQKIPCGIFNFEMDTKQLLMKTMSMKTGLNVNVLRNPHGNHIPEHEFEQKADEIIQKFDNANLFIVDDILNEQQIFSKAKEMVNKHGVKIIVIDYLLLIDSAKKFGVNYRDEINHLTKFFKRMARKLDVIVILVSQANDSGSREAEGKGLSRDSNYYFYVEQLSEGQEVIIGDEDYRAQRGDFIIVNRGIRHGEGNKAFLTRFIENDYKEIDPNYKYFGNGAI